jgi:hypothetical protein
MSKKSNNLSDFNLSLSTFLYRRNNSPLFPDRWINDGNVHGLASPPLEIAHAGNGRIDAAAGGKRRSLE